MDSTRKGMVFSTVVHVAFFGVLLLIILLENLRSEPEPIILTLESPPSPDLVERVNEQPAQNLPDIAPPPMDEVKQPDFAEIPDPQPTPPPPAPTPPPPAPTPPKPKVEKKPEPQPEPVKPMSIDKFREQFKIPEQKTVTRKSTSTPRPAPQIDIDDSLQKLLDSLPQTAPSSQAEKDALRAYIQRLHRQIEFAWRKPELATHGDEWVKIIVTVLPNGKIKGFRVDSKSCSAEFLRSVDAAIANTQSIGPTPNGQTLPVSFTMRLREE